MSVAAIMLVKDEADIIATTVRHLLGQVDEIFMLDNGSTDGTREILQTIHEQWADGERVTIEDDPEVGYYQSWKMTELARRIAEHGHDWVVPVDADEIWYSVHGRIADILGTLSPVEIAEAVLYDHVATGADPDERDPVLRMGWRNRTPGRLPKVAARVKPGLVIEQGNHGAHYPGGVMRAANVLTIRHFPYRSAEQMVQKVRNGAAAYRATNLPRNQGQHWREYGDLLDAGGPEAIHDVFRTWFWHADPAGEAGLIYDPAPL